MLIRLPILYWLVTFVLLIQKRIYRLGVLFALLLVFLVIIQILWIQQVIELEEKTFKNKVSEVLTDAVSKLEVSDSDRRLKILEASSYLYSLSDTLSINQDSDQLFKPLPNMDLIDYEEFRQNKTDSLSKNNNALISDSYPIKLNKVIKREESVQTKPSLDLVSAELDLNNKTTYVTNIVKRLIEVDINQNVTERIDKIYLDSILQFSFSKNAIDIPYEYLVVDNDFNVALRQDNVVLTSYSTENYDFIQALYPNDVLKSNQKIYLRFPSKETYLYMNVFWLLFISLIVIISLISLYGITLYGMIKQKKISEIKNDFINNMTHELKTPISTISLAYEALKDDSVSNKISQVRYIDMIGEENNRLNTIVHNVLRHAVLDKGEIKMNKRTLDLHVVIMNVIRKMSLVVSEKGGVIQTNFKADDVNLNLDELHITNLFSNLIDNALKYCKNIPEITINTYNEKRAVIVEVMDNGIGIKKDNQKKVFDKLFRVSTGNVHDVKGFGLGLSYVKKIMDEHDSNIEVISKINHGSTFKLTFPINKKL